ncbi:NAD(P)-binding protein [Schizophyllum commune H4-8]|nr:NAD(P)-binding protein [Schizophyllum commune H4-8]KAI5884823.1 NAD(P)-binding protein [Schizophyllum commune H4-8]
MPPEIKSIAVAGAQGSVGKPTILALASVPRVSVLALTRKTASRSDWLPQGVAHAGIDFDDVDGTADVLREHKVEVLISAVSHGAVLAQIPLADAAKAAGVGLFVPSEFGTITMGWREEDTIPSFLAPKIKVADHLDSIGLPSLRIFVGMFIEAITTLVGYDVNKKVNIFKPLQGDTPFSATSAPDIGGFIAHVVTHYPLSELANKALRIEGERLTLNGLGAILKAPVEKVEEVPSLPGGPPPFIMSGLQTSIEKGLMNQDTKVGENDGAGGADHMWPGHRWTTMKEYLQCNM